jgi:hypothetical protein
MSAKKMNLGFETQFHLVEKTFVFNYKHAELLKFFPHQKLEAYLTTIYMFSQTTLLALPTKARIIVFRFIIEYGSLRDFGP